MCQRISHEYTRVHTVVMLPYATVLEVPPPVATPVRPPADASIIFGISNGRV